ncbi:PqqD family protein [Candidatus Roizmanbacteria bacterium]|nr:PqqD family protein [Candidatus Roizmanbacteria bacterium]
MPVYVINRDFVAQKLGEDTIIFDGSKSILYTLNETASYVFQKIKIKQNNEAIVKMLAERYGMNENKVGKDVNKLISDLIKKRIVFPGKPKK